MQLEFPAKFDQFFLSQPSHFHAEVLVIGNDKTIFHKQHGKGAEAKPLFALASITKHMTAVAVLKCVEQNLLDLHTPVAQYLKIKDEWAQHITLHHMLTHTTGLLNHTEVWDSSYGRPLVFEDVLELLRNTQQPFKADELGRTYRYNNTGYYLAGMIIELVSGQPLDQFMGQHLFTPAGITDIRLIVQGSHQQVAKQFENMVMGYKVDTQVTAFDYSWIQGAGAVISTSEDLAQWGKALFIDQIILRPESLKLLLEDHQLYAWEGPTAPKNASYHYHLEINPGSSTYYTYGLRHLWLDGKLEQLVHPGCIEGYLTDFRYLPDTPYGPLIVVGLSNRTLEWGDERGGFWQLVTQMVRELGKDA